MNSAPVQPQSPEPARPPEKVKIIDSLWAFLVAVAFAGPLALPLLWRNPRYSRTTKIVASIAVCLFTWALVHYSAVFMTGMLAAALNGN